MQDSHDAIDGRADFVTHVGQELALRPTGVLGARFGLIQLGGTLRDLLVQPGHRHPQFRVKTFPVVEGSMEFRLGSDLAGHLAEVFEQFRQLARRILTQPQLRQSVAVDREGADRCHQGLQRSRETETQEPRQG